jgi:hypothetical protein
LHNWQKTFAASRAPAVATILVALAASKLVLLGLLGPLPAPDTPAYTGYAGVILRDSRWLTSVDFTAGFAPIEAFRMAGYPLLIALARCITPQLWDWAVVLIQILVALLATLSLYRVLWLLSENARLAASLTVAQAAGLNFVFDQSILTDSLYLSLLVLVTCALVRSSIEKRLPAVRLAFSSIAFAACLMLREASTLLCPLFSPLLFLALVRSGYSRVRATALVFATFLPLLATSQAYKAWNEARTGISFLTTGYQTAALLPLVEAYRYDSKVFAGSDVFDSVARAQIHEFGFSEVLAINEILFRDMGWSGLQIAREVERRYWQTWLRHPLAMVRATLSRIRLKEAMMLVQPFASLNMLWLLANSSEEKRISFVDLGRHIFLEGQLTMVPLWAADLFMHAAALSMLVLAGASILITACSPSRRRTTLAPEVLALAFAAVGIFGAHLPVHVESRYLMPCYAIIFLICAWGWRYRYELFRASLSRVVSTSA